GSSSRLFLRTASTHARSGHWHTASASSSAKRTALFLPQAPKATETARQTTLSASHRMIPLELDLGAQAVEAAPDRRHRAHLAVAAEGDLGIARAQVALDDDVAARRVGVPDVVDADVVVHAPEERRRREARVAAEHVLGGGLALALRHRPVLDANALAVEAGIAGDVAGGVDAGDAGLHPIVDEHAEVVLDVAARGLRELDAGPDADAHHPD